MITKKPRSRSFNRPKNGRNPLLNENSSAFDNPRYDNRTRPQNNNHRNYQQLYDKYLNLAREAFLGGDRVTSESHYQYADHYLRLLNERQHHWAQNNSEKHNKSTSSENSFTPDTEENPNSHETFEDHTKENCDKQDTIDPLITQKEGL